MGIEEYKAYTRQLENDVVKWRKKSSIDFDCMEVTEVKVNKFKSLPGANRIKGVAEIVLNDQLILRGLRIIEGSMGLYVGFPIDPFFKGEDLRCIAQPITRKLRENIENCILEKYQEISIQEY